MILTYYNEKKKLTLILNSINNPPLKRITVKVNNKNTHKWERKLEKNEEIFNTKYPNNKKFNFFINRKKDFKEEIKLLLNKNKKKDLKYLNLNYAIKVNLLLKRIFTNHV